MINLPAISREQANSPEKERGVRKLIFLLSLALLCSCTAIWPQLLPPNEIGVTMGQVGLNVRDVDANKKFFSMLGGTPINIDGTEVVKFPGVFIFLTPGNPNVITLPTQLVICSCPSDNVDPSVVNHIGFLVHDWDQYLRKFKDAGVATREMPFVGRRQLIVYSPDHVALEMAEDKSLTVPIAEAHVHFFAPAYVDTTPHTVPAFAMYTWYSKMFGVKLQPSLGGDVPGVHMRFSATPLLTVGIKGRPIDHIGFEVTNLEAFCKKLEARGIKFDEPYSTTRHKSFSSAMLTDPWGVSIELTEGLNRF